MTARTLLLLSLAACGGPASSPAPTPAPQGPSGPRGPSGSGYQPPKPAPLDPALATALQESATRAREAVASCMTVLPSLKAVEGTRAEPDLTAEALAAACDGVTAVHDTYSPVLLPHFHSANRLFGALARLSEDARVLGMELSVPQKGDPFFTAIDHLRRSLPDTEVALADAARIPNTHDMQVFTPRRIPHGSVISDLRRLLTNDVPDLGNAPALFDNYAWNQRDRTSLVRTRLLMHFGHWFEALTTSHKAELASLTPEDPNDQPAFDTMRAYVAACEGLTQAYLAAAAPFVAGTLQPGEADQRRQQVAAAHAAWQAAHDAAVKALGG